jgi:rhodanese-related sulfurtransferase
MPESIEITPQELKRRMEAGEVCLIDCRETGEHRICRIEGAELVPMREVPARLPQIEVLAGDAPVVIYCHHGMRSLQVAQWLRQQGIEGCQSLAGGIDRWSCEVDPAVPRY